MEQNQNWSTAHFNVSCAWNLESSGVIMHLVRMCVWVCLLLLLFHWLLTTAASLSAALFVVCRQRAVAQRTLCDSGLWHLRPFGEARFISGLVFYGNRWAVFFGFLKILLFLSPSFPFGLDSFLVCLYCLTVVWRQSTLGTHFCVFWPWDVWILLNCELWTEDQNNVILCLFYLLTQCFLYFTLLLYNRWISKCF